jgi:hypothetical protein
LPYFFLGESRVLGFASLLAERNSEATHHCAIVSLLAQTGVTMRGRNIPRAVSG